MLYLDSCSHYSTSTAARKWDLATLTSSTIATTNARHGKCLRFGAGSNYVSKTFTASTTVVVGFAFRPENVQAGNAAILCFLSGGSAQSTFCFNASGTIDWRTGPANGTVLGTTSAACPLNTWTYVEIKIKMDNAAGTIDIFFNGVNKLSLTGKNTSNTTGTTTNTIQFNSDGANRGWSAYSVQDIYVLNSLGSQNNAPLGDMYVEALFPTGPGASTAWTIGGTSPAATNWQSVNEVIPDDDVTYVTSSTVSQVDEYAFGATSLTPTSVAAVQFAGCLEKLNAGPSTVSYMVRDGGVDYPQTAVAVPSGYGYALQVSELHPATGLAWTGSEVNADQYGIKLIS